MTSALLISVRFHDGRYHGADDWPPAPARLFKALVAAAPKTGDALEQNSRNALAWLERLPPPVIAAPSKHEGQHVNLFVPNNDIDSVGGIADIIITKGQKKGPAVSFIKTGKSARPRLFDASVPLLYIWRFDDVDTQAKRVCGIADGLYQLGRGVDMAWATAEVMDDEAAAEARLAEYPGVIYRPSEGENDSGGTVLDCPERGSLESLIERYKAGATRFRHVQDGRITRTEFSNAPKPRFRTVAYNSPATRLLFDIRRTTDAGAPFDPWPLKQASALVQKLRDGAVGNLAKHFDDGTINKVLIGRDATEADKALRLRIVPLPSIGHAQVNRSIRRVLVEVPPNCPVRVEDVAWAFAGLEIKAYTVDEETGELLSSPVELLRADDESMLAHYGVGDAGLSSRVWRSITPLVLPDSAKRRRIDPAEQRTLGTSDGAKHGNERLTENRHAMHAVAQALRHVGLRRRIANIRVQREPFEARGERAEAFADGTRFNKHQLWHVEIEFAEPVHGLTLLGSGRYAGLGLMAPVRQVDGVHAFAITDGLADDAEPPELARALRRAVMARAQEQIGRRQKLPIFFTGHEGDGKPARSGSHAHLAFVPDLPRRRLLVIAPHIVEHREPRKGEPEHLATLAQALAGFNNLNAGKSGKLRLARQTVDMDSDPLFAASSAWIAQTKYQPTRHAKKNGKNSLQTDVLREAQRRGMPVPEVIHQNRNVSLKFLVAVPGPVLLGKDFHFGGGLFSSHPITAELDT
jgi:CRISPR-associated protein Csb2